MRTFGISPTRAAALIFVAIPVTYVAIHIVAGVLLVDYLIPRRK